MASSGSVGNEDSASRLRYLEGLLAMVSDLDLSAVHAPSSDRAAQPLHSILSWDADRLKRVSRWRGSSEDTGKDVMRAYVRVILALEELGEAAQGLPFCASLPSAPNPKPQFAAVPQSAPAPHAVVLKSAVRASSRRSLTPKAPVSSRCLFRWKPPSAIQSLPSEMMVIIRSWASSLQVLLWLARLALDIAVLICQWLPCILVLLVVLVLLADPVLFARGLWISIRGVPVSPTW